MADAVPSPEVAPKERTAPAVFEYDSRFEFDAPRFYDFEALGRGGSPHGDHWFSTAPDGPGCKPDKGVLRLHYSRHSLKAVARRSHVDLPAVLAPATQPQGRQL